MATVKFLTKGNADPKTIYVRFRDGRKIDFTQSTGHTIFAKNWSDKKSWILPRAEFHDKINIENRLHDLEKLLFEKRNEHLSRQRVINRTWFEGVIQLWLGKGQSESGEDLPSILRLYMNHLPHKVRNGKVGVAEGTIKNYNTTLSRILKFQGAYSSSIEANEIDLDFHSSYLSFAKNTLNLSPNSIGKDIKNIKTSCQYARDQGINVHKHVFSRNFSAPSEETHFTTLNEEEIELLRQYKGLNYLENARDWLVIGCWTGCRVGDLMKLKPSNVTSHKDTEVLQYTQSKTNQTVTVPLHPHVVEILERNEGFPRPLSQAKFNKYIKEVCKRAGLTQPEYGTKQNPETHLKETGEFPKWQLVRSHICRRSFATNHYNKLPNKVIMAVTGHSTESMLLKYIGKTETTHIDDYLRIWKT